MKSTLKIIAISFVATTAFWCLLIVGLLAWCSFPRRTGVDFIEDAQTRGYFGMMSVWNHENHPVTFSVTEVRTNSAATNAPELVLFERQLPPSAEFWIGVRKTEPASK
jgi:hypothetical protein